MTHHRALAAVALVGGLLTVSRVTTAQGVERPPGAVVDTVLEAQTRALASELRCPVCQGLSLQDSPSELAQQMRAVVHDQLAAGKTPGEVRAYFVAKYGEWILLEPEKRGVNLLVYLLPVAAIVGGAVVIVVALRKWTAPAETNS